MVNCPSPRPQLLVPAFTVTFPSLHSFWFINVSNEQIETKNSYFETQTQKRENITKPVSTNLLFPIYDLA